MQQKSKCAIYTRVSTDMQAEVEFNSCEAQEAKIRSFINSQENMEIFKVYSDAGFTGANTDRPALAQMLNDVRLDNINLIIAYKIDRLTRSPKDFYQLIEIFDKHGVDFISVTERFDTSTPSGRLLRNIMLTFAQFERELTSERTKDKLMERARKGMWNGGSIPFGYKNENKKLVIHPEESVTVKNIYEDYITSHSLAKVCQNLKDAGVAYRTGQLFYNSSVSYILRNPVYTGKIHFSGKLLPGNHEAIISQAMFDEAQEIHRNQRTGMKIYKDFPLAGLIRCQECGSTMTPTYTNKRKGRSLKRYYYYRCTKTNHGSWNSCSTKQVSANRLEDHVFGNLERLSLDKQYVNSLIFALNNGQNVNPYGSSNNPGKNGLSRVHSGLELSGEPSKISPEIFSQTLAGFLHALSQQRGSEKNLLCREFIEGIDYAKESIQIRLFAPADASLPCSEETKIPAYETPESSVRTFKMIDPSGRNPNLL